MKRMGQSLKVFLVLCILLATAGTQAQENNPCSAGGQTSYFGVELNGVLCGYSVETYCDGVLNGTKVRYEYSDVTLKMSALGASIDGGFRWKYVIDPVTDKVLEIHVDVINGESTVTMITRISGDSALFISPTSGVKKTIQTGPDVIFATQSRNPHLYNDFIKREGTGKRYKVFDPVKGEILEKEYLKKAEETVILNDSVFRTLVLEETEFPSGIKTTLWLNMADGFNVKTVVAGRRVIFFADRSVTSRVTIANIDDELFTAVNRKIPDFMNLSWLKVKANLNSFGEKITVQSLNFPGQKFEGTVTGSLIEGLFEIKPVLYTGKDAPPFPPDFSLNTDLTRYLAPELVIESDDPLIVSEAARITAGSKDSWEAAVRIARWVAENIAGVIPGGISAANTLKTREAECGGHSRLMAALCRAVGIPAKVVAGCMYTMYHSGGFGQHAWTEVYMGNAGWIPVDATINEPDYIDAGHIKLGENSNFRPVAMEVLDFRSGSNIDEGFYPGIFRPLIGSYMNVELYRMFKIIERNGSIALEIPGRMVLDLNFPDDDGKWFPKLTREISLKPENIKDDKAGKIILQQYYRLKKTSSADSALTEIPEELRVFAGKYQFAPARLSIDVVFKDGTLLTNEPLGRSKERISYVNKDGSWTDKSGVYKIGFITDGTEKVITMNFTVDLEFIRGEPVSNPVGIVIKESGVIAGIKKYNEIKKAGGDYYFFSEQMLHQLGHSLLKEERIDDAIKVFEINVLEYPGSFMANDALAEAYLKNGDNKRAVRYFKAAVRLNPEYVYGLKMIKELKK